ncbi:MAG: alkaline phosphatase [Bacteroidales bacterium]|nr:alkaline phosphatase [Bacteroidales bacterium]
MKTRVFFSVLVIATTLFSSSCTSNNGKSAPVAPKNVVVMIGDGMGTAQVYSLILTSNEKTSFERFPYTGFSITKSASNEITDSAAGGTAIAIGKKTNNGVIGMNSDSIPVPSMLDILAEQGKKTGVVVTCSVTHATPADFIAHNISRKNNEEIALEISEKERLDVLFGGGKKYFTERNDKEDLIEKMWKNGWNIYDSLPQITDNNARTMVLTCRKHMKKASERGDYLPKATAKVLEMLDNENGFFLMVEGSQIDFACHDNDSATMVDEMRDFNKAINVVLDFAEKDRNTLVIVTADHETGGLSIIDPDGKYTKTNFHFSTGSHSAVFVPVFAYGPGAENFTGIMDNTEIISKILEIVR